MHINQLYYLEVHTCAHPLRDVQAIYNLGSHSEHRVVVWISRLLEGGGPHWDFSMGSSYNILLYQFVGELAAGKK